MVKVVGTMEAMRGEISKREEEKLGEKTNFDVSLLV